MSSQSPRDINASRDIEAPVIAKARDGQGSDISKDAKKKIFIKTYG